MATINPAETGVVVVNGSALNKNPDKQKEAGDGGGTTVDLPDRKWLADTQLPNGLANSRLIQNASLLFFTAHQTLAPIMVRKAHGLNVKPDEAGHNGSVDFLASTTVFVTVLFRISLCSTALMILNGWSVSQFGCELRRALVVDKRETARIAIPALVYVVQDNLYFFALKHLEATLFQITYQLRLLTTALLSVVLLRRYFSPLQWASLLLCLFAVILVQMASHTSQPGGETGGSAEEQWRHKLLGIATVLVMCWTSAFAGVYLERLLKKSDVLMQNIRLSAITLPFAAAAVLSDREAIGEAGFFRGWSWLVWAIAFASANNGIIVAAVIKYADNIKKGYCQSVALGATAFISIAIGDSNFSYFLVVGMALVIGSIILYECSRPSKKGERASEAFRIALSESSTSNLLSCTSLLSSEEDDDDGDDEEKKKLEMTAATNSIRVELANGTCANEGETSNVGRPELNLPTTSQVIFPSGASKG